MRIKSVGMFSLYDLLPKYLLGKYQLTATVVFTAFFSLVFLLLSIPFSNNAWFRLDGGQAFGFTVTFFFIALAVVITSKILMYQRRDLPLNYLQFILWNVAEVVAVCALYSFFTHEGEKFGILDLDGQEISNVFFSSLLYGFVSLGVPYIIAAQYFAIADKNNTIRLMNLGGVVGDMELPSIREKRITLFDNNGTLKFSVDISNLIYIESDDNYVKVWYMDGTGEIKQYMLRCRLKTIEDSFSDSDLVRCHRKYVVNISKVSVLRREKDSYYIDLGTGTLDSIPVSKTYEEQVISRFNSR